ncbi:V-type ATP synthase subunit F [Clostridiaceae bacterium NSJ-31]|uniref:V-type ATP synthase subunit F n=1 Tax=Ligaoa zhengdingensis TaxID=2763658 RepID=A0A926DZ10_9FIRM|nr:V-type ATP synthase subunit F [Ligaoa zhengdingensis]MBC8546538.1 V-type ATP synthase subunit F [Ligaoa zhengdingensis]
MAQEITIAAIGDRDSVMLFHALGIHAVYADDAQGIEKAIHQLAHAGCAVIYITEQAAVLAPEAIERYKTEPFPAIIPIPNRSGSLGLGMQGIRANVEKAIGADILFGEGR